VPATLPDLLADAPANERSLLELLAQWPSLPEAHERVAARLRVFVLNWDPLSRWAPSEARATATGDGDSFELVLYVPLETARDTELLGDLCRSVLEVGVEQELLLRSGAYAQLAAAGKAPELLSARGALSVLGQPAFAASGAGWEPIGLGAIQDLVQAQLGPVDLDRSRVKLEPVDEPAPGCPACAGRRFGFPAELAEAQPAMCAPHFDGAAAIVAERLERARASNPEGWRAIADAAAALDEPTYGLPLALLSRLERAIRRIPDETATDEQLRGDAAAALELAEQLRDRPADFDEWIDAWMAHDWMSELALDLARRGLVDDAVRVADAFAELDPQHRSMYAGDAAVILAEAGRGHDARARAEANVRAFPRDVWTCVHAGDVHRELGDHERAEREYRRAGALAEGAGDGHDAAVVAERLADLLSGIPGRERDAAEAARAGRRARAADFGQRIAPTTGRNDPCPCGSGRKFKKCCGA
jgi:tetratricopeptide (TPR) repeat protein